MIDVFGAGGALGVLEAHGPFAMLHWTICMLGVSLLLTGVATKDKP